MGIPLIARMCRRRSVVDAKGALQRCRRQWKRSIARLLRSVMRWQIVRRQRTSQVSDRLLCVVLKSDLEGYVVLVVLGPMSFVTTRLSLILLRSCLALWIRFERA